MYPSTINNPSDTFFTMSSSFTQNPIPTQNMDPPFFPEFSSSFLDDNNGHLFFDQLTKRSDFNMVPQTNATIPTNTSTTEISSGNIANKPTVLELIVPAKKSKRKTSQQRRPGKKDRHSKIYTAQGLRDRRMRLSLQIARKFFDLQDMLGFDKASKTIEWLFTKSKKAIKEVTLKHPQMKNSLCNKDESIASECEVESMVEIDVHGEKGKAQKVVYDLVAREMRDKARARARERTREKMIIKSKLWQDPKTDPLMRSSNRNNSLDELGYYSSPFETGEESSSRSREKSSPYEPSTHSISNQLGDVASNSSMMFDDENVGGLDTNNYFLGFLGSWETEYARISSNNNYCGIMTPPLTSGNFHEQNLSSLFTTSPNIHCHDEQENN